MPKTIKIMNANAIELALKHFGDATAFVSILQANQLDDWFINEPVVTSSLATSPAGSSVLTIPPTADVKLEDLVYSPSINQFSVVRTVTQNYVSPGGTPFCQCSVKGEPTRVLPNVGTWLSTTIEISPPLATVVNTGTPITFTCGQVRPLVIPNQPPTGGLPQ